MVDHLGKEELHHFTAGRWAGGGRGVCVGVLRHEKLGLG